MALLTIENIAERMGFEVSSVRSLRVQSRKAHTDGTADATTMPRETGRADDGRLLWDDAEIDAWLRARAAAPSRRGGVRKDTVRDAIALLEAGNVDAAIAVMRNAVES